MRDLPCVGFETPRSPEGGLWHLFNAKIVRNNSVPTHCCPNCGARRPASQATKHFWKIWGVAMVGFFVWFQIEMALESPEQKAKRAQERILHAAGYACKTYAKNSLDDSQSAEFDAPIISNAERSGRPITNRFDVVLGLRARNAFGASVRGTMYCTVVKTGEVYTVVNTTSF